MFEQSFRTLVYPIEVIVDRRKLNGLPTTGADRITRNYVKSN